MKAEHVGPIGGMIVICVEPGTEVTTEDGTKAMVDENHTVISGKGALYVTPRMFEALKRRSEPPTGERPE